MAKLGICLFALVALALSLSVSSASSPVANQSSGSGELTNLSVTDMFVPSNVSAYSPLQVSFNITNVGSFAAENVFVNLHAYGSEELNSTYYLSPLSPGQSDVVTVYIANITNVVGRYIVYIDSGYVSGNATHMSGSSYQGYGVVQAGIGSLQESYNVTGSLPNMYIDSIPFLSYQSPGSETLSQLLVSYNGTQPATLDFGVPSRFSGVLGFSSQSLYWLRSGELGISVSMNPSLNVSEASYIIPVSLTETTDNDLVKNSMTRYIQLYILNGSQGYYATVSQSLSLNDSESADGVLQIHSPSNYSVGNSSLELMLPSGVSDNESGIGAYGAAHSITETNGWYAIKWQVGSVQPDQNIYLYYSVDGLSNQSDLDDAEIVSEATTQPTAGGIFRVVDALLPVLYSNATRSIEVDIVYTGASAGTAMFDLLSTPNATVHDPVQYVQVTPNEDVKRAFNVTVNNFTGTMILKLRASINGRNFTYDLPVVVLQEQKTLGSYISGFLSTFKYLILIVLLVIMIIVIRSWNEKHKPVVYNPDRGRTLINIRNQIKREE